MFRHWNWTKAQFFSIFRREYFSKSWNFLKYFSYFLHLNAAKAGKWLHTQKRNTKTNKRSKKATKSQKNTQKSIWVDNFCRNRQWLWLRKGRKGVRILHKMQRNVRIIYAYCIMWCIGCRCWNNTTQLITIQSFYLNAQKCKQKKRHVNLWVASVSCFIFSFSVFLYSRFRIFLFLFRLSKKLNSVSSKLCVVQTVDICLNVCI